MLTPAEAATLEAIAAQIFPTDETPGAREAGVIHFIDRAFETFAAPQLDLVRAGLRDVEARAPGFASLPFERQTAVVKEIEPSPLFGIIQFLTVAGMFANPEHGGNRNHIGWQLLGFEMRPAYQPPFGYYDREAGDAGR